MKKVFFLLIILCGISTLGIKAQWQTYGSNIYYNNGDVGIGTSNPNSKLHVNGRLFLQSQDIVESWLASYLHWSGHRLIMGSLPGVYAHNSLELRPGGAQQGLLHSELKLYTALMEGLNELKVLIHSNGTSFFNGGNVGIGTTDPEHKLDVVGTIRAHQVLVNTQKGADFVFEDGYALRPLEDVEQFISENKRLPDIPSAQAMIRQGVDMGELQVQLLQKIEELTLYVIQLKKEIEDLKSTNN